jgi:CRP/FNR family transcriptional regulator
MRRRALDRHASFADPATDGGLVMIDTEALEQIPRFAGTDSETRQWLAARLLRKSVSKNESLFHEGDDCAYLYLVEDGAVKIMKLLESGKELILGIFRAGEAIGEVALIDGEGYPATAVAHEDATVLMLSRPDYFYFLDNFPDAPRAIIRDLTLRMRTLSRRVQDLGGGGVDFRLARVLLTLAVRTGQHLDGAWHIPVAFTRQDLANLVGARLETVILVLTRWRDEGLVTSSSLQLILREPEVSREIGKLHDL